MAPHRWSGSPRFYDFLKGLNAASLRRNWRVEGEGLDRLERFRGGILALNHGHLVDGSVVMPLVRERIAFLCDARAVDAPLLGTVLRSMGIIRVDVTRSDPAGALAAAQAARDGCLLGMFPEARVSGARGLLPARPGVAFLASRLELPVLPVAMWGVEAFDRPLDVYVRRVRPVIHVRVGVPHAVRLPAGDRAAVRNAADAIMLLIAGMLPPELRDVYRSGAARCERGRAALERGLVTASEGMPAERRLRGRAMIRLAI